MKTEFNTASLKKAYDLVLPATTRNSPMSILKSIRLRFAAIDATDTIVQITAPVEAAGDPINVCVPVEKLHGILAVAGDTISFEHKGGFCTVKTGKHRFKVAVHDGENFPVMAQDEDTTTLDSTPALHAALARVGFAAAKPNDVRQYLTGILIECAKDTLHVTATSGFSLATVAVGDHHTPFRALVPKIVADTIAKWQPGKWSFSQRQMIVEMEDAKLITKLLEGAYPDWPRIFGGPAKGHHLTVPRNDLLQASALSKFAADNAKVVRAVKLKAEGDVLKVSAAGGAGDKIETDVQVVDSKGPAFEFGFDGNLLEPVLRAISPENVEIRWNDPTGSVLIEDGDFRSIVMPYRV